MFPRKFNIMQQRNIREIYSQSGWETMHEDQILSVLLNPDVCWKIEMMIVFFVCICCCCGSLEKIAGFGVLLLNENLVECAIIIIISTHGCCRQHNIY